ncbi:hypothetical protein [Photobacterium sp. 1_MG-2023]|uniref:hypothetical protein n=1 Tax=Photobacterium sp. 1_MG-2023 TaxID=3062646 RepID=UPI0026E3ABBC|nr:hypothetical protein [Photobacterium sp. 1_MG-2023]MDO6706161.1 hypothetical protein [Photobacterium sp. 1_MG-2023]
MSYELKCSGCFSLEGTVKSEDGEDIEVDIYVDDFEQSSLKLISERSHKSDNETWLVVFTGHSDDGEVVIEVTYSQGLGDPEVEDERVVTYPFQDELDYLESPSFEFEETEDEHY